MTFCTKLKEIFNLRSEAIVIDSIKTGINIVFYFNQFNWEDVTC